MPSFQELAQKLDVARDQKIINKSAEEEDLKKWVKDVSELFDQITAWAKPLQDSGTVQICRSIESKWETPPGAPVNYTSEKLIFSGEIDAQFSVCGRYMIGSLGCVNLKTRRNEIAIHRFMNEENKIEWAVKKPNPTMNPGTSYQALFDVLTEEKLVEILS